MIIGIGNDLVDVTRIEQTLTKYGPRFVKRLFTDEEQAQAAKRKNPAPTLAKRFAAKEACAKALGTGMNNGVFFCDMGVVNLASGAPTLVLTGGARERLDQLTPKGHRAVIHLSISDELPLAQAFVVIEAVPIE